MEDIDVFANLKGAIEAQVAKDKEQLNDVPTDSKIIIAIVKGPTVLIRLVKVVLTRKVKSRVVVPSHVLDNIKT